MAITHDPLLALAATQHGLFTTAQAERHGVTRSTLQSWERRGRILRVHRGVYSIAGVPEAWAAHLHAACLASRGVVSHRSAARLLGIGGVTSDALDVSLPRTSGFAARGIRVFRRTDFDLIEPIQIEGMPVTDVGRLLVDVGSVVSRYRLGRMVDQACAEGRIELDDVLRTLIRHARRGRNGTGALREILDERLDRPSADSVLEGDFLRLVVRAGLPLPESQIELFDEWGFIMRLDYGYPDRRVGFEIDSVAHHLHREAFEWDRSKRNRAKASGWSILEFTHRMIRDRPAEVCTVIAHALGV